MKLHLRFYKVIESIINDPKDSQSAIQESKKEAAAESLVDVLLRLQQDEQLIIENVKAIISVST